MLNACRAIDGQSPEDGTRYQDRVSANGQGFENVCTAPETTVAVDFAATGYGVYDLR
jgi:hypothetical protein